MKYKGLQPNGINVTEKDKVELYVSASAILVAEHTLLQTKTNIYTSGSVEARDGFVGDIIGTGSWAINALTASFVSFSSVDNLITFSSSVGQQLNSLETTTGSLNTFSSSAENRLNNLEISTGSLNIFSSSAGSRLTNLETTTGSILNSIGNLNTTTSSLNSRVSSLEQASGSIRNDFNLFTGSYNTGSFTGSFKGDGSQLTGLIGVGSGVTILDSGVSEGVATTIDFDDNLQVDYAAGIATIRAGASFPYTGSATITGSLSIDGFISGDNTSYIYPDVLSIKNGTVIEDGDSKLYNLSLNFKDKITNNSTPYFLKINDIYEGSNFRYKFSDINATITAYTTLFLKNDGTLITFPRNSSSPLYFFDSNNRQFLYTITRSSGGTSGIPDRDSGEQSDGKVIIVGSFTTGGRIRRLTNEGFLDSTFNSGVGANGNIDSLAIQNDDKIIIGGSFTTYSGSATGRILRINPNGNIDTSFNVGTGANSVINAITIQQDGKIIIGGNFGSYSGSSISRIVRINTDGTIDTSFNVGTGANNEISAITIQQDGKILIGGNFTTYSGSSVNCITRLNIDGTIDTSFNVGSGLQAISGIIAVRKINIFPSNRISIVGSFTGYSGSSANSIVVVNNDGTIYDEFLNNYKGGFINGSSDGYVRDSVIKPNGNLILVYTSPGYNNAASPPNPIIELNEKGQIQGNTFSFTHFLHKNPTNVIYQSEPFISASFKNGGTNLLTSINVIEIQNDEKIIFGGSGTSNQTTGQGRIRRINSDGTLDTTFSGGFPLSVSTINDIEPNFTPNRIYIGGNFRFYSGSYANAPNNFIGVDSSGTVDSTFNPGGGTDIAGRINQISGISGSKLLIAGQFFGYSGSRGGALVKLSSSGELDTTFTTLPINVTVTSPEPVINDVVKSSDEKIYIVGFFIPDSSTGNHIRSMNSDGTTNTNFNSGVGFSISNRSNTISIFPDNKIIVGGTFTSYSGSSVNGIIKINTDGTRDTSFNVGNGASSDVRTVKVQTDGKVVIGGQFTSYSGSTINRLARLNTNGTLDTSLNVGTGISSFTVYDTLTQPDGKIIVVGSFFSYSGSSVNNIVRINSDGTRDTTFNIGTGTNGSVWKIALQSDGKIIIGGNFSSYSGSTRNYVARLNIDGTVDTSFSSSLGSYSTSNITAGLRTISLQSDNKIIIGGSFRIQSGFDNVLNYARLNEDGTLDTTFNIKSGATEHIVSSLIDENNNIFLGGARYTTVLLDSARGIARINENGSIDNTFNVGLGTSGSINSFVTQSDGKIIIVGDFREFSGSSSNRILRLNENGTVDTSFNIGTGPSNTVNKIIKTGDKYIIIGSFTSFSGSSASRIIRLNSDGTIDRTFNIGTGFNDDPSEIISLDDGKIIVTGGMTLYSGSNVRNIVMINNDGTINNDFNNTTKIGPVAGKINSIALNNDGEFIVAGDFREYDEYPAANSAQIFKLNKDGSSYSNINLDYITLSFSKRYFIELSGFGLAYGELLNFKINSIITYNSVTESYDVNTRYTKKEDNLDYEVVLFVSKDGRLGLTFNNIIQPIETVNYDIKLMELSN